MAKKIIIDAGHGGSDPGAVGNDIIEKDLTLNISNYIHQRLDQLGIPNKEVRSVDESLDPKSRIQRIMNLYGNDKDIILISNHINAGGGEGAEIIYALRNNDKFSKIISSQLENDGREVRKYYQRRYPSDSNKDYYFIHRDTGNIETVIVEYGFLDNLSDSKLLKDNWQSYAESIVKAICTYIGVKYVAPEINDNLYVVKSGDTLWSIAKYNNISVDKLKEINSLKDNTIFIGQKLKVNLDDSNNDNYYIVKSGDNLYSISKKYGISVNELKNINNLKSDFLSVDQKLIIPSKKIYYVKSGDTLYSIAKSNNLTVDKLKNINGLKNDNLSINQKLYLN